MIDGLGQVKDHNGDVQQLMKIFRMVCVGLRQRQLDDSIDFKYILVHPGVNSMAASAPPTEIHVPLERILQVDLTREAE